TDLSLLQNTLLLLLLILLLKITNTVTDRLKVINTFTQSRAGAFRRPRAARGGITNRLTDFIDQGIACRCHVLTILLLVNCYTERNTVITGYVLRDFQTIYNVISTNHARIHEQSISTQL